MGTHKACPETHQGTHRSQHIGMLSPIARLRFITWLTAKIYHGNIGQAEDTDSREIPVQATVCSQPPPRVPQSILYSKSEHAAM